MTNIAKRIWRQGIVGQLSTSGLLALEVALATNDARLLQGVGVYPLPLVALDAEAVQGACVIGFAGWQGDGIATVGKLDDYYATIARDAEQATGEEYALGHFLAWYDDCQPETMRREMLAEVRLALAGRQRVAA